MTIIIINMAAPTPPTSSWSMNEENALSSQVSIGETAQNAPKLWERAWSVQEIRSWAGKWSLAGDAGLLLYLQEFSQRVISRTHEVGKEVDGLAHEAQLTGLRVNNVVNDFIMLANTQFVENRVYDEDVSQEADSKEEKTSEQQEKTREQREAELIPRVTSALKLGIDVIDLAFEKLDTTAVDSESEDEDNTYKPEPILEAKDPYINRPLPFMIGTPQFLEDDCVGLVEELSDEEQEMDQGSISVSEEERETESEYTTSEESEDEQEKKINRKERRAQTKSSTYSSEEEDDESADEMFSTKKSKKVSDDVESDEAMGSGDEETEEKEKARPLGGPSDFASELATRLGVAAPRKMAGAGESEEEEKEDNEWGEEPVEQKRKDVSSDKHARPKEGRKGSKDKEKAAGKAEKDKGKHSRHDDEEDNLFGQGERNEDDDFFGKSGGLFSTSKGLFDDDDAGDDEGGLFGDAKSRRKKSAERDEAIFGDENEDEEAEDTQTKTKSGKVLPKGAVPIFGAGEDLLATSKPGTSKMAGKKPTVQAAPAAGGGGGLFDDNEEEDDLFGGVEKKAESAKKEKAVPTKTAAVAPASKKVDLFADHGDDEDDDLFGAIGASGSGRKKSHSNVGLTVEGYDEGEKVEEKKLEDEKLKKKAVPERKLPAGAVSMFGSGPNPIVAALKKQQGTASSDEEDKDDWSEGSKNSRSSSIHSTSSLTALKTTEGAKNSGSSSSRASSIFADEKDDDGGNGLFTPKPKSDSKPTDKPGKNLVGNLPKKHLPELDKKKSDNTKLLKDQLFDNDDEDDFFGVAQAKPIDSKKSAGSDTLFGGASTSLATKANKEIITAKKPSAADKKKEGSSLFDDDEEEDAEPLFTSKPSQPAAKKDTPKNKARDLFDDDDLLFGAGPDESPSVDLFSQRGAALTQPSQEKEATKSTVSTTPKKTTPTVKPTAANLFSAGGDDADDNDDYLFSAITLTKPPSEVAATATGDPVSESMETKEKETRPEVRQPKKPAGAVSMFGGLDPSALLKKRRPPSDTDENEAEDGARDKKEVKQDERKANEEEKEKPVKEAEELIKEKDETSEKTVTSRPKSGSDLFGGGHTDSNDLFSPSEASDTNVESVTASEPTDTPQEEVTSPKPETTKPKKLAGAVSMFGGLDPSAFLKKRKVEEPDEREDEGKEREKPHSQEHAPETAPKPKVLPKQKPSEDVKPRPPSDLFGGVDDDEDDLFATSKKKVPPPTAPKSPASTTPKEAPKSEEEHQSPDSSRPKKPAGAVSIFGGIDPFANRRLKSSLSADEESKEDPTSPTLSPLMSPSMGKSLERSDSVDFDQPAEADTLTSASKDRPKLNRRRPQSRKARMLAASGTGISFEDVTPTTPTTPTIPEVPDHLDLAPPEFVAPSKGATGSHHGDTAVDKSKPQSSDLFGNDDLVDGPPISSSGKSLAAEEKKAPVGEDLFSRGLFGGKSAKASKDYAKDLFSGPSKVGASASLLEKSKISDVKSATDKTSKKDATFDDLFSKPEGKTKTNDVSAVLDNDDIQSPAPVTTEQKTKAVAELDDDDLFATPSMKSSAPKGSNSKLKSDSSSSVSRPSSSKGDSAKPKAAGASQDDDIFAASGTSTQKETKAKSGTSSTGAKKDESASTKSADDSKNVRPKKAVTKEEKLLADSTDIFSDIPDPAPKEPKKKAPKKVTEKKTVFKDDVDDIFAETSAAAVKPKKEARKKVGRSAAVDSDDIFDDPLK